MGKKLTIEEAIELLQNNVKLEYKDEDDFWCCLSKDSPIRLLWEHEIRVK